jgi:hypothetical protein
MSASDIDIRALAEVLADVLTERGLVVATRRRGAGCWTLLAWR